MNKYIAIVLSLVIIISLLISLLLRGYYLQYHTYVNTSQSSPCLVNGSALNGIYKITMENISYLDCILDYYIELFNSSSKQYYFVNLGLFYGYGINGSDKHFTFTSFYTEAWNTGKGRFTKWFYRPSAYVRQIKETIHYLFESPDLKYRPRGKTGILHQWLMRFYYHIRNKTFVNIYYDFKRKVLIGFINGWYIAPDLDPMEFMWFQRSGPMFTMFYMDNHTVFKLDFLNATNPKRVLEKVCYMPVPLKYYDEAYGVVSPIIKREYSNRLAFSTTLCGIDVYHKVYRFKEGQFICGVSRGGCEAYVVTMSLSYYTDSSTDFSMLLDKLMPLIGDGKHSYFVNMSYELYQRYLSETHKIILPSNIRYREINVDNRSYRFPVGAIWVEALRKSKYIDVDINVVKNITSVMYDVVYDYWLAVKGFLSSKGIVLGEPYLFAEYVIHVWDSRYYFNTSESLAYKGPDPFEYGIVTIKD